MYIKNRNRVLLTIGVIFLAPVIVWAVHYGIESAADERALQAIESGDLAKFETEFKRRPDPINVMLKRSHYPAFLAIKSNNAELTRKILQLSRKDVYRYPFEGKSLITFASDKSVPVLEAVLAHSAKISTSQFEEALEYANDNENCESSRIILSAAKSRKLAIRTPASSKCGKSSK